MFAGMREAVDQKVRSSKPVVVPWDNRLKP